MNTLVTLSGLSGKFNIHMFIAKRLLEKEIPHQRQETSRMLKEHVSREWATTKDST